MGCAIPECNVLAPSLISYWGFCKGSGSVWRRAGGEPHRPPVPSRRRPGSPPQPSSFAPRDGTTPVPRPSASPRPDTRLITTKFVACCTPHTPTLPPSGGTHQRGVERGGLGAVGQVVAVALAGGVRGPVHTQRRIELGAAGRQQPALVRGAAEGGGGRRRGGIRAGAGGGLAAGRAGAGGDEKLRRGKERAGRRRVTVEAAPSGGI